MNRPKTLIRKLRSQSGFSIMEVMVASGLMMVMALSMSSLYKSGFNTQKALQARDDARTLTDDIMVLLSNNTACENTFGGVVLSAATAGTAVTRVLDKSGSTRYSSSTSTYGNNTLKFTNMTVSSSTATHAKFRLPYFTSSAGGTWSGTNLVVVNWSQPSTTVSGATVAKESVGPISLPRYFLMNVTLSGSTIVTCQAVASNSVSADTGTGTDGYYVVWNGSANLANGLLYKDAATTSATVNDLHFKWGSQVGIQIDNPYAPLHIWNGSAPPSSGTMSGAMLISNGTTSGPGLALGVVSGSTLTTSYSWIQSARVNNAGGTMDLTLQPNGGQVGIGAINPRTTLEVAFSGDDGVYLKSTGTNNASVFVDAGTGSGGSYIRFLKGGANAFWIMSDSSNNLSFRPRGGNPAVTITSGGAFGLNQTNPAYNFDVTGGGRFTSAVVASGFAASSDVRLKHDIHPIKEALSKVLQINGITFRWNDHPEAVQMGLLAQNVEKVAPEVVGQVNVNGKNFKTVAYQNLVSLIIEAIKEIWNRFLPVEQKMSQLEKAVAQLQKSVELLQSENRELKARLDAQSRRQSSSGSK